MVRSFAVVVLTVVALAGTASAFCGFYVAGSSATLTNDATQVVLMRSGTRTVLAMQNDYKGPPEAFALIVPVPVVLQKADVKTLPKAVFAHVEAMGAPRLVEYWEQDPCPIDQGRYGTIGHGTGTGAGYGIGGGRGGMRGRDLGVTVEATFAVGEYQIVILSAKDSTGLDTWLRQENYKIPAGTEPLLRPYVESGMKFFVAKVDPAKVTFDGAGRAALSPLRFHYDSEEFSLPIRLGLANSSGTQDLIVSIFSPYQRYEVANYKNVTIPTNIDVDDRVRGEFGAFYAQLFDRTLARNPGAVVTEYVWQATKCDPCTGPTLQPEELATLGGDVLEAGGVQTGGGIPTVSIGQPTVTGGELDKAIIRRYIKRNIQKLSYCYEKQLLAKPGLAGTLTVSFGISADGKVTSTTGSGVSPEVASCVTGVISTIEFPRPKAGSVQVTYPFTFALGRGGGGSWGSNLVLTRLHARYGKEITNDLVFKKADPIVGGRELVRDGGQLEQGARPDTTNNFQGRYAIRHPWTGPIACANPQRNVWGGPPPQETRTSETLAATGIAFAARTGTALHELVKQDVPEIAVKATSPAPYAVPAEMPPEPTVGSGSGSAVAAEVKSKPASGCGCDTDGGSTGGVTLAGLVVLVLRRRRRVRRRS